MEEITLEIPGTLVAQGRGRIVRIGQHARIADPAKSREWKSYVRYLAAAAQVPGMPWAGPVRVGITMEIQRPKSRKRGSYWVTTKPDLDNAAKGLLDALNGIFFHDDRQVSVLVATKTYSEESCTTVTVRLLDEIPPQTNKTGPNAGDPVSDDPGQG